LQRFVKHIRGGAPGNPIRKSGIILVFLALEALHAGRYANAFLEIGCGARALSLGGAVTSFINDGTAFFWNPAGLSFVNRTQISGMYGPQFGDFQNPLADYHYIGIALPLVGDAVIAVNWIRLGVDDIPLYPELQGDSYYERLLNPGLRPSGAPSGFISDVENAIFVSFAKKNHIRANLGWMFHRVRMDLPFGVNIKWIRQSIGDYQASGIGIDLGAMLRISLEDLVQTRGLGYLGFGLHLQDVTRSTMTWNTKHQDSVPVNVIFGTSYDRSFFNQKVRMILAVDRESRWGGDTRLGAELCAFNRIFLRIGRAHSQLTGGAGLRVWKFTVDYAFQTHELDALHRVSCGLSF